MKEEEERKMVEVKKREKEAKAYLAAQKDAREKGLPIPGVDDRKIGEMSTRVTRPNYDGKHADRYASKRPGRAK